MNLTDKVRGQADAVLGSEGRIDPDELRDFARNALALCEHAGRVHKEMTRMIDGFGDPQSIAEKDRSHEIDLAAIETQRETHELKADPFDVLKALLMWRDDPADRLRKRE